MSFDLADVWGEEVPPAPPLSARAAAAIPAAEVVVPAASSSTPAAPPASLADEVAALRRQLEKRDMMFATALLILFAVATNHFERVHRELRTALEHASSTRG